MSNQSGKPERPCEDVTQVPNVLPQNQTPQRFPIHSETPDCTYSGTRPCNKALSAHTLAHRVGMLMVALDAIGLDSTLPTDEQLEAIASVREPEEAYALIGQIYNMPGCSQWLPEMAKKVRKQAHSRSQRRNRNYEVTGANPYLFRAGGGLPLKMASTLRYHEQVALNPAVGSFAVNCWSLNGCYDPNITGTGHQPSGFDQLMTFYYHYTVVRARVSVLAVTAGSSNMCSCFGLRISGASTLGAGTVDALLELDNVSWRMNGYPGAPTPAVKASFDAARFFGWPRSPPIGLEPYRGDVSSNPTEQAFCIAFIAAPEAGDDPPAQTLHFDIEYDVVFTEPRELAQS